MTNDVASLRFAVAGTGLIGGSVLRRLHVVGADVIGWDLDPDARAEAAAAGLRVADTLDRAVADRDVVFAAAPLSRLPALLDEVAEHVADDCVVTDVGSTKADIVRGAASGVLGDRFIGGHPMAGTEFSGIAASRADLFADAAWVLCPTDAVPLARLRRLIAVVIDLLGARPTLMPADVHDSAVAFSSHIPHLLAGALAGATAGSSLADAVLAVAAGSFRDSTRVAATVPRRTVDMVSGNRAAVLAQLDAVRGFLDALTDAVRDDDRAELADLFGVARELRLEAAAEAGPVAGPMFLDGADEAAEREFLMSTGVNRMHLISCGLADDHVTYTVESRTTREPPPP